MLLMIESTSVAYRPESFGASSTKIGELLQNLGLQEVYGISWLSEELSASEE
jgi:hypothetical protein